MTEVIKLEVIEYKMFTKIYGLMTEVVLIEQDTTQLRTS
jgi:hypothetical protein